MPEAIIFADAHVGDDEAAARVERFLDGVCEGAARVYILGDLFNFWFGPKQAEREPYGRVLRAIKRLGERGVKVTFFHGNRDFYMDEGTAAAYGFTLVRDSSVEEICGKKVFMCHGDMLCRNDKNYHRMRAVLRNPLTEAVFTRLPAFVAERLARLARRESKRAVGAKTQWVLGIDDREVLAKLGEGADVVVCGHTHKEDVRTFDAGGVRGTLYTLGDFGAAGAYLVCDKEGFTFHYAKS